MSRARDLANLGNNATGLETLTVSDITDITATADEINLVDGSVSGPLSNRNMIINGAMQIWQRSTDVTCYDGSNETYNSVDRWSPNFNGGSPGTLRISRSTDTPDNFGYSQKLKCDGTGTPTSSNQMAHWRTMIEAQDLQHLNYGSSSAKVMTLSWYMKSVNYTSPLSFYFIKYDNTTAYYVKSVTPTTSWARYSITIPGNTNSGHGIDNDNGLGLETGIMLSGTSGGLYERTGDSGNAWGTNLDYYTNTQGNFFSSTSNELYITGVQLELGSVATPFEMRTYGEELARCQRYYQRYTDNYVFITGQSYSAGADGCSVAIIFPVQMRDTPQITTSISTDGGSNTSLTNNFINRNGFMPEAYAGGGTSLARFLYFTYIAVKEL